MIDFVGPNTLDILWVRFVGYLKPVSKIDTVLKSEQDLKNVWNKIQFGVVLKLLISFQVDTSQIFRSSLPWDWEYLSKIDKILQSQQDLKIV